MLNTNLFTSAERSSNAKIFAPSSSFLFCRMFLASATRPTLLCSHDRPFNRLLHRFSDHRPKSVLILSRPLNLPGRERMSLNLSAFPTLVLGFLRLYRGTAPTTQRARVPRPLSTHIGQKASALLPWHLRSAK